MTACLQWFFLTSNACAPLAKKQTERKCNTTSHSKFLPDDFMTLKEEEGSCAGHRTVTVYATSPPIQPFPSSPPANLNHQRSCKGHTAAQREL